ncbi:MAG: hypothetical protein E6Q97_09620 [Desulfurellales bacterium]|nr:MAG: hypothetical protein E6Q97_09620 [Desulfurellales bacterium]
MKYTVSLENFDALMQELLELPERANASIARTLNFVAQSTAQRAKGKIRSGRKSGHVYYFDGVRHQASAPGEAPANLSGSLAASITFTKITDNIQSGATAGSDLSYAATLEFGGYTTFRGRNVYVEPRPFLLPSFEEAIQQADIVLKREFERGKNG